MLKKARQKQTWQPSDDTFKRVRTRRIPKVIGGGGEKEVMLFDRIAREKTIVQPRELSDCSTPNHWILRLNADGPQKKASSRPRPEFAVALKTVPQKMQDAHLAETRQSLRPIRPEHQQRQREDQQFEGGENFDSHVDRKNWTAVLQRATVKPVGSVFIFYIAVEKLAMASELELMVFHIIS